ncbi:hypothetical protein FD04_GL001758 [Secundilactobacillus odoratitofui DSM 19909 = JCM 15043]|uniref:Sugar specific permease n=1 Tax=Secundilactobacillus odoratitofui DSM 19909 = JCM 15043 TaxID=1423776 RepID=A0A0R1LWV4_9LACO|nr:hypothetical protein [Secundilactobacillus odoratitofui]KRK96906.1 hypothetical protein FD04_GL001758 [Secundilactobacillus odoratitofui DSM 19909 = JCM 15043]
MYQPNGKPTILGDCILLVISIIINSLGNALTVSLNLGSALWTASAVNLAHLFQMNLGNMLLLEGVAVILANALLLRHFDWHRMLGNVLFMVPFSYLVSGITHLFLMLGIQHLPLVPAVILDIVGVMFIGCGISIYQRINLILHPNDDLMQIIRFKFLHGNAVTASLVAYLTPLIIILVTFSIQHQVWAVNIGTFVALFFSGTFIALSDRYVFARLKHQRL